jgi:hypothetical protein
MCFQYFNFIRLDVHQRIIHLMFLILLDLLYQCPCTHFKRELVLRVFVGIYSSTLPRNLLVKLVF